MSALTSDRNQQPSQKPEIRFRNSAPSTRFDHSNATTEHKRSISKMGVRFLIRWCRVARECVSVVVAKVRTRVTRGISAFVEATRTLWTSPDESRDVPGPVVVSVESTGQVQPTVVAPVIVRPAEVVRQVPGRRVPGPVRMVSSLELTPASVVPPVFPAEPAAGPLVTPGPTQAPTAPRPAPELELGSSRDLVRVTEEDILAGEICKTVVKNGCEYERVGPVCRTKSKRLSQPPERLVVKH